VPVYVHADELPMAAGRYLPQYSMPLDRWLVIPLMRLLPAGTRARIEAANSITNVVRPLDPQGGVPGLPEWRWVSTVGHTPGHAAYLRPRDGVLIAGDAALTVDLNSGRRGAGWPAAGGRPAVVHDLGLAGGQAVGRSAGGVGTACAAAGARTTPDRRDGHRAARAGLVLQPEIASLLVSLMWHADGTADGRMLHVRSRSRGGYTLRLHLLVLDRMATRCGRTLNGAAPTPPPRRPPGTHTPSPRRRQPG
jgi:glyoxylase-like metal-dependent hydrolase (beta-lactamase superfamily II)